MGEPTTTTDRPLGRTPVLDGLLGALRRRLVGKIWLHGLGTALAVGALWLAFAFLADWGLRVPRPVRILHGLAFVVLVGVFVWRDLLRPMRRVPSRSGLALLVERRRPELRELLVSAVQFQERPEAAPTGSGDPELVGLVLAEADRSAAALRPSGMLDDRPPRRRFLAGLVAGLVVVAFALARPDLASIFADRMLGGTRSWPQRTHLTLDVPGLGPGAVVERTEERILLRVARGTDLPVLVRAVGVVPGEVELHFEEERDLVLPGAGGGLFRTLLRSLQEDVRFYATGGDDRDGLPRVEVEVLQPPDVEGLAMVVEPPAYSGLPRTVQFDRDVEVLAGSRVAVHVLPFPPDATGIARLLPEDETIELASVPYPRDEAAAGPFVEGVEGVEGTEGTEGAEAEPPAQGLGFELVAERSVGFRIELVDDSGLSNPEPGLFRIRVVEDRPPDIALLSPARSDFEIVRGGAIPLRARAEDDFGLVSMRFRVLPTTREEDAQPILEGEIPLTPLARDPAGAATAASAAAGDGATPATAARELALGNVRLEVDSLGTEAMPVAVDQRYELVVLATDDRQPEPGVGRSHPIRARVVTPEELLRRMQDRLGQARLSAVRLSDLQREKRRRVEDLLAVAEGDGAPGTVEGLAVAAALTGQRRVQGDAQALARDLAVVAEDILYARLDDKAGAMLEFYDQRQARIADPTFHPGPLRELARAVRAGELGPKGFAANLVDLVDLALEISEDHAASASAALDRAEKALDAAAVQAALVEAAELQGVALQRTEDLLAQLAEWDNFQNVLALTRDILNRQKALRQRTQQFASEK